MLQSVQSENVPFVGAYVSLCDLACTFMSYPLLDDLFLSASRHLCSYFAVCLPSAELPINHLWVNIQKLRTLCSINRSLNRSLIGADSRTHLSRSLFVDPPHPHWVPGGTEDTSVTGKWIQLWLCWCFCNLLYTHVWHARKVRHSTALSGVEDFTAGNSVLFAILNS